MIQILYPQLLYMNMSRTSYFYKFKKCEGKAADDLYLWSNCDIPVDTSYLNVEPISMTTLLTLLKENTDLTSLITKIQTKVSSDDHCFKATLGDQKLTKKETEDYIKAGFEIDPDLFTLFKTDLFYPNDPNTPPYFMRYGAHQLVFTGTKAGKSSIAQRTSFHLQSASSANLLGFSTANDTSPGSLNTIKENITIDEIMEEKSDELLKQLILILENGATTIAKGKQMILTRTLSGFRIMSNPPKEISEMAYSRAENQKDLFANSFLSILSKISHNTEAFGSRFACILFNPDTKPAEYQTTYPLLENKLRYHFTKQQANAAFSRIIKEKNFQEWLEKPFSKEYTDKIDETIRKIKIGQLKDFLTGHKYAHRHARGMALLLACFEQLDNLLNCTDDIEELTQEAENQLLKIEEINLNSFNKFAEINVGDYVTVKRHQLIQKNPLLTTFFLLCLQETLQTNTNTLTWEQIFKAYAQLGPTAYYPKRFRERITTRHTQEIAQYTILNGDQIIIQNPTNLCDLLNITTTQPQEILAVIQQELNKLKR